MWHAGDKDADGDSNMAGNGQDFTGELTGRYDLIAVLTHKGRSLDSGHYVAWCKQVRPKPLDSSTYLRGTTLSPR
jgi:ubiquitin carboxyl-terminal hydrolase 14